MQMDVEVMRSTPSLRMSRVASSALSGMSGTPQQQRRTPKPQHPRSAELFRPGATWVEDVSEDTCAGEHCRRAFTFLVGKHHCRWCGRIFCDSCAPRRRRWHGETHRCCRSCTLPVIFRSFVNPFTGERESTPLQCILSFLTPKSITALMHTCSTMMREFPVRDVPYYPSIQSRFPSFYEGAQIGKGAFGVVYKCEDRLNPENKYVAIKRLIKRRAQCYSMWRKIITETGVLQAVQHPHVAGIIEVFQTNEDLVIVMESGQGGTLRQAVGYLYSHKLPVEPFAATVLLQISQALDYLYREHHIIHRDVKLDNIVVSANFTRAMLIDFGLAEYVSKEEDQVYVAAGTPGFASPENIYAAAVNKTSTFHSSGLTMHKGDIFSLGVTAFIILSRHRPIHSQRFNKQYLEVERGIACTGPGWENVTFAAANLVARMLSLRPEDRPSAVDIAADPFVVSRCLDVAEVAAYRRAAREREDAEEQADWVVVDVPTASAALGDVPEYEPFLKTQKGFIGSLYGALVNRSWWL